MLDELDILSQTAAGGGAQPTLTRVDLNDLVYESVKGRLLTREFAGGQKLSLQTLADELGVSRSPVHHALTRLVTEGLVVSERRRGYVVRPLTIELMDEVLEARAALEMHAAELTVPTVSDESLARLRNAMQHTLPPVSGQQIVALHEYMRTNQAFHELQVDLAGNSVLSDMYRRLCVHQLLERAVMVLGVSAAGGSSVEHAAIVSAYEARDVARARAALRANVDTGRSIAREAIARIGGSL
jgi:DNA-binding GntR family transcriptional regulator